MWYRTQDGVRGTQNLGKNKLGMTEVYSGSPKGFYKVVQLPFSPNPTLGLFDGKIARIYFAYNRRPERKKVGGGRKNKEICSSFLWF